MGALIRTHNIILRILVRTADINILKIKSAALPCFKLFSSLLFITDKVIETDKSVYAKALKRRKRLIFV